MVAVKAIVNSNYADDYNISTGIGKTVENFVNEVFKNFNLDYKKYIIIDNNIISRKAETRIGNNEKILKNTPWSVNLDFNTFVKKLVSDYIFEKEGK